MTEKKQDKNSKNILHSVSQQLLKATKGIFDLKNKDSGSENHKISKSTKMGSEKPGNRPKTSPPLSLQSQIEFHHLHTSDTIYRLRYDSMTYDFISPACERLLGYTVEELQKQDFRKLILETRIVTNGMKRVSSFRDLEEQRKKGDVDKWQADYLVLTKDDRKIWISDISYPWIDEENNVIGSIGTLRDITDRIAVEAQLREELAKIAYTDALTDLANRREFFSKLDHELKRIKRTKSDVAILVADIDHFKRVNDYYGHSVGDKVLREISGIITSCLRETDLAARLGGEEFGIILPDTGLKGAYWVAERIRAGVAKHEFEIKDALKQGSAPKKPINCTISLGVAAVGSEDEVSSTDLYRTADGFLYIAKNTGRNQVSVDETENVTGLV